MAEVLAGVDREDMDQLLRHLSAFGLREVSLSGESCARRLAVLRVTTRLKLPDCCVLLAAEDLSGGGGDAVRIATLDARLGAAAGRAGFATLP
jgi:hypothetical protein